MKASRRDSEEEPVSKCASSLAISRTTRRKTTGKGQGCQDVRGSWVSTTHATHRIQAQKNEKWDCSEATPLPFLQRHGAVRIIVDLDHHVLQNLSSKKRQHFISQTRDWTLTARASRALVMHAYHSAGSINHGAAVHQLRAAFASSRLLGAIYTTRRTRQPPPTRALPFA